MADIAEGPIQFGLDTSEAVFIVQIIIVVVVNHIFFNLFFMGMEDGFAEIDHFTENTERKKNMLNDEIQKHSVLQ